METQTGQQHLCLPPPPPFHATTGAFPIAAGPLWPQSRRRAGDPQELPHFPGCHPRPLSEPSSARSLQPGQPVSARLCCLLPTSRDPTLHLHGSPAENRGTGLGAPPAFPHQPARQQSALSERQGRREGGGPRGGREGRRRREKERDKPEKAVPESTVLSGPGHAFPARPSITPGPQGPWPSLLP